MATRLAKGSRVEVMRRNADDSRTPPYSWRCGDLLSFNSQQFIVRLDDPEVPVQCVSRDCIRPCPPPFVGRFRWKAGDPAELFEDHAWWPAKVVDVDDRRRVVDVWRWNSATQIRVRPSKLRQRKQWIHAKWSVIDKSEAEAEVPSQPCEDRESCNMSGRKRMSPSEGEVESRPCRRQVVFWTSSVDYSSDSTSSSSVDYSSDSTSSSSVNSPEN
ncbi:uncharacterized protein LOC121972997 [Zingiber officinale]|uniref:uncharacterized protein LOC121972997 n=1 Tax=Zingiber officinale TaxID=94328 RepID=UPI001C4B91AB|nr:uncharacterized protein LOC121972997 [Zingiber officinale]